MNIALLVVAKNEEQHLLEFIEHYNNICIDTIFFCDNNDNDNYRQKELLEPYIKFGFVRYYDYHDIKNIQHIFYNDIYFKEKDNFDWFCVFDCDEFIELGKYASIKDFINDTIKNNSWFDLIQLNWKVASYKELTYHNTNKTYAEEYDNLNFKFTSHVKSMFRSSGKIKRISGHYPVYEEEYNTKSYIPSLGIIDFKQNYAIKNILSTSSNIYIYIYITIL